MKKKQLKKVTKRVMEEILAEEQHNEIFGWLDALEAKKIAKTEKAFEQIDVSEFIERQCTQKEIQQIHDCVVKAIKEELAKEHSLDPEIRKEHSFYMTMRLMIALWILNEDLAQDFPKMNNREKYCYKSLDVFGIDICICADKILSLVSYLDS